MIATDLTSRPLMPIASAPVRRHASRIACSGCLMPMLWISKPLFERMMSTRFLPMSWTSPATVASTIFAFLPAPASALGMCGSSIDTAFFMTAADCSTNGSCIWPEPKSSPTVFMPASRWSLMIASGGYLAIASTRVLSRSRSSPSMMWRCRRSSIGRSASDFFAVVSSIPSGKSEMKWSSGSKFSALPAGRSAPRLSKMSHSAASQCSGAMRLRGMIFEACTIAAVRPRSRACCRNTLLSTARAAGLRPKEMFDRPRMMPQRGNTREISAIPSSVSRPRRRSSSLPVAMVKVSGSKRMSSSGSPHLFV